MLLKALAAGRYADKVIGSYMGFDIVAQSKMLLTETPIVLLKGELTHKVELSESGLGSIARIENAIRNLDRNLADNQRNLGEVRQQMEAAKQQMQRPFEQEETLQMTLQELVSVNSALDMDKPDDENVVLNENQGEDVLGIENEGEEELEQE